MTFENLFRLKPSLDLSVWRKVLCDSDPSLREDAWTQAGENKSFLAEFLKDLRTSHPSIETQEILKQMASRKKNDVEKNSIFKSLLADNDPVVRRNVVGLISENEIGDEETKAIYSDLVKSLAVVQKKVESYPEVYCPLAAESRMHL